MHVNVTGGSVQIDHCSHAGWYDFQGDVVAHTENLVAHGKDVVGHGEDVMAQLGYVVAHGERCGRSVGLCGSSWRRNCGSRWRCDGS